MARRTQGQPAPYRELPDPQVLDAASQYAHGFDILITLPPGSGVLLPAMHSGAIALELYLKAWGAEQIEVDAGTGTGIVTVHARPAAVGGHGLEALLGETPQSFRDALEPLMAPFGGSVAAVRSFEGLFVASRYPYEEGRDITQFSLDALTSLVHALREATQATRPLFLRPRT